MRVKGMMWKSPGWAAVLLDGFGGGDRVLMATTCSTGQAVKRVPSYVCECGAAVVTLTLKGEGNGQQECGL